MKFIMLIFKIIAASFVVLLMIVTPIIEFLCYYATAFLKVVSGIVDLISIVLLISGEKLGIGVFLFLPFLVFLLEFLPLRNTLLTDCIA